ncbi:MAG: RtcB family protein [Candidatus Diapherotrites archaeon]|nr:RtcB family protein [Candidatus Diapherotrites archaeon]
MKFVEKEKFVWEVPKEGDMLVPARVYADETIANHLKAELTGEWSALRQLVNVASLPGIQKAAIAMSDVHPGYGFPIGGVAAFDVDDGVITMAGIGFDVNCGVRTIRTPLKKEDVEKKKEELAQKLFEHIPAGLGSTGKLKLDENQIDEVLIKGSEYVIEQGYGLPEDLEYTEEKGRIKGADPSNVSHKAKKRQYKQVGTLGSGNHYLEVQYVEEVFDEKAAKVYGLEEGQVVVSLHCGSRALGHQVGTDYLQVLEEASKKYGIPVKERELVSAPFQSPEGQKYFSAVNAAINCAFANRQVLNHLARESFNDVFGLAHEEMPLLYDIAHNTCKLEEHEGKKLIVHRKGSTRAFGPGRKEIPKAYRSIGQPVLIGGTMGTHSYILHGTEFGMKEAFGSACHGAGRRMSRAKAKREWWGESIQKKLLSQGIVVKGHSRAGLAEEAPGAYKDVDRVVNIMHDVGLARKVVKLKPMVCIKG